MSMVKINWSPNATELRRFGAVILVGCGGIGLLVQFVGHRPLGALILYVAGALVGGLGIGGTRAALPFYRAWMAVAFVVGNVVSRVIVTVFYHGLLTPMGLIMRTFGEDHLRLRRRPAVTYWVEIKAPGAGQNHERQF